MAKRLGLKFGLVVLLAWSATFLTACPADETEIACEDGVDDDGDGRTDCEDSDCSDDPACQPMTEVCDDGADNDGDGDIDCEDSDCEGDLACVELCDDGEDNDLDGDVDCGDADCVGDPACVEDCADGIDNDGDGDVDCGDSDCEGDPSCFEECEDGLDNDGDGDIDCDDSDCVGDAACVEIVCDDGADNDGDGDVDCDDSDCDGDPGCNEPERGSCDDGIDNDRDGDTDCADSDCSDDPACLEICDDGIDNDADGDTDCADSDCAEFEACQPRVEICDDLMDNDGDGAVDCIDPDCRDLPICNEPDDEPNDTPDQATEIPTNGMTQSVGPGSGNAGPNDPDFYRFELCRDGAVEVILAGDGATAELRDSDGTTVLRTSVDDGNGLQFIRYYGGLNPARTLFLVVTAENADTDYEYTVGLGCPQDGDDFFDLIGTGDDGNNQTPATASPLERGPEAFETTLQAVLLDPEETPNRDRDNYGIAVCGGGRITVTATYEPVAGEVEVAIHAVESEGVFEELASGRSVSEGEQRVSYLVPHRLANQPFAVEVRSGVQRTRLPYTVTITLECPGDNDLLEPNDMPGDATPINVDPPGRREDIAVGGLILAPGDVDNFEVQVCAGGVILAQANYDSVPGVVSIDIKDGDNVVATADGDGMLAIVDYLYTGMERRALTVVVRRTDQGQGPVPYDLDVFLACPNVDDVFDFLGGGEDGGNDRPQDSSSIRRGPEPFDVTLPLVFINPEEIPNKHRDNLHFVACGGGRLVATASYDIREGELELTLHSSIEGQIETLVEGVNSSEGEQRLVYEIPFASQGQRLIVEAIGDPIVGQTMNYSLNLAMICPGDNDIYEDNDTADMAHDTGIVNGGETDRPNARLAEGDVDFYRLEGCGRGTIGAFVVYDPADEATFVMELRDSDGVTVLATATQDSGLAEINYIIDRDEDARYFIVVRRTDDGVIPFEYRLGLQSNCPGDDDVFDTLGRGFGGRNNLPAEAAPLAQGPAPFSLEVPLKLLPELDDTDPRRDNLFFEACAAGRVSVTTTTDSDDVVELRLYREDDPNNHVEVATGRSVARGEAVLEYTFPSAANSRYVIEAYSEGFRGQELNYNFSISLVCPDGNDLYEDNDTTADATVIVEDPPRGGSFVETEPNGLLLAAGDVDVFRLGVCTQGTISAFTSYDPQEVTLRLELIAPDGTTVLATDDTNGGLNAISFIVGNRPSGDYFIRVTRLDNGENIAPYRLRFVVACPEEDDVFDVVGPGPNGGNDTPEEAVGLGLGPAEFSQSLSVTLINPDLAAGKHRDNYLVQACGGGRLDIVSTHNPDLGQVALRVYTDGPTLAQEGPSPQTFTVPDGEPSFIIIEAVGSAFTGRTIPYELTMQLRCPDEMDDRFEENDTQAEASEVAPGELADLVIVDGDPDWYAVEVCARGILTAVITPEQNPDNVDFELSLFDGRVLADTGTVQAEVESFSETARTFHARVRGVGPPGVYRGYGIAFSVQCPAAPDLLEDNDNAQMATQVDTDLAELGIFFSDLNIEPGDPDFFAIDACPGGRVSASVSNLVPNDPAIMSVQLRRGDTVLASGMTSAVGFNATNQTSRLVFEVRTSAGDRFTPVQYGVTVQMICPGQDGLEPNDGESITPVPSDETTTLEDLFVHMGDVDVFGGPVCRGGSVEVILMPLTQDAVYNGKMYLANMLVQEQLVQDFAFPFRRVDFEDAQPPTQWRFEVSTMEFEARYRLSITHRCPDVEICTDGVDNNDNGMTDCRDPDCADDAACDPPTIYIPLIPGTSSSGDLNLPPSQGVWSGTVDGCGIDLEERLGFYLYPVVNATGADQKVRVQANFFGERGLLFAFDGAFDPDQPTLNCIPGARNPDSFFADNFYDLDVPNGGTLFLVVSDDFFDEPVGNHRVTVTTQGPGEDACFDEEDNDFDGVIDCVDVDCRGACREDACNDPLQVGGAGQFLVDFDGALDLYDSPCGDPGSGGPDVVYEVTPDIQAPTTFCVDTVFSSVDTRVFLADPDCANVDPGNLCNDGPAIGSQLQFIVQPGESEFLVVEALGDTNNRIANLTVVQGACAETMCEDGMDDDGDNLVDCSDSDCALDPACVPVIDIGGLGEQVMFDLNDPGEDLRGNRPSHACGVGDGDTYDYRVAILRNDSEFAETVDLFASHTAHNGTLHVFDVALGDFDINSPDGCLFADANGSFSDRSVIDDVPIGPGETRLLLYSTFRGRRSLFDIETTVTTQEIAEDCTDGVDNDRDDDVDCDDSECTGHPSCVEVGNCDDGMDNDGDDAVDCDDVDCAQDPICEPANELLCEDDVDNDNDGATDCNDSDCGLNDACFVNRLSIAPGVGQLTFAQPGINLEDPMWQEDMTFCGDVTVNAGGSFEAILIENNTGAPRAVRIEQSASTETFGIIAIADSFDNCIDAVTATNFGDELPRIDVGTDEAFFLLISVPSADPQIAATTVVRTIE